MDVPISLNIVIFIYPLQILIYYQIVLIGSNLTTKLIKPAKNVLFDLI